jgi:hypothetical protein
MLLWLESQSIPLIALLVFTLCYALAGIVFLAMLVISRRPVAVQLKTTSPLMLKPLSASPAPRHALSWRSPAGTRLGGPIGFAAARRFCAKPEASLHEA